MADNFGSAFSDAFSAQQRIGLAERAQQYEQEAARKAEAEKIIQSNLGVAAKITQAAADAGKDPMSIAGAIQPLIESAAHTAETVYGPDGAIRVQRMGQALLARPALDGSTNLQLVKTKEDPVTGQVTYGTFDKSTGKLTPIPGGLTPGPQSSLPSAQPQLSSSDTLSPSQVAAANPSPVVPVANPTANPPPQPAVLRTADNSPAAPSFEDRFNAVNPPPQDSGTFKLSMEMPSVNKLPDGVPPGAPAVDYAIQNNVTGNEFLKALPPVARNKVLDVSNYKIPLTAVSKRADQQSMVASWVHQYTGGEYDAKWYQPMQRVINDFAAGTSNASPAQAMVVGNTAIQHLGTMADAVDAMAQVPGLLDKIAKSNTSFVSYASNALKNKSIKGTSEGMALQSFLTARNRYVDEITKFYGGAQGGSEEDRKRSIDTIDAAIGLPGLYASMNTEAHLLDSKVNALQDRWKTGQLGPKFADTALRVLVPDFPIIQQKSKAVEDGLAKKYLSIRFANGQNSVDKAGTPISASAANPVVIQNGWRYDAVTHQPLGPAQ